MKNSLVGVSESCLHHGTVEQTQCHTVIKVCPESLELYTHMLEFLCMVQLMACKKMVAEALAAAGITVEEVDRKLCDVARNVVSAGAQQVQVCPPIYLAMFPYSTS